MAFEVDIHKIDREIKDFVLNLHLFFHFCKATMKISS